MSNDPAADTELTVAEAIALGASKDHDNYTAGKYYVTGEITEVYNTTYGNMKIKDAEGNILTVFGTYSKDGKIRYDAMDVKPVAGDTVKVYGIIGKYSSTPQMKNGWIVEHTPAAGGEEEPDAPGEVGETTTVTISIADYAAANGWADAQPYSSIETQGVKITATGTPVGNYGLNTGKYYVSNTSWRIYQNENAAITISAEGKTIVSVKFTYSTKNSGVITMGGQPVTSGTVAAVNAATAVLSVGNTGSKTNGNVQITAIEVVYG